MELLAERLVNFGVGSKVFLGEGNSGRSTRVGMNSCHLVSNVHVGVGPARRTCKRSQSYQLPRWVKLKAGSVGRIVGSPSAVTGYVRTNVEGLVKDSSALAGTLNGAATSAGSGQPERAANLRHANSSTSDDGPISAVPGIGGQGSESSAAIGMARNLLSSLSQSMEELEEEMSQRQEDLKNTAAAIDQIMAQGTSLAPAPRVSRTALTEAEGQVHKLTARLTGLQREVELRDVELAAAKQEVRRTKEQLGDAESAEAQVITLKRELEQRDLRLAALARDLSQQATTGEQDKSLAEEALHAAELRVGELMAEIMMFQENIAMRDVIMSQMQRESSLSTQTLQTAAQAISQVREQNASLERELEKQREAVGQAKQETARALENLAQKEVSAKEATKRMARLEEMVHQMDSNLEQENAKKQQAEADLTKSKEELTRTRVRVKELENELERMVHEVEGKSRFLKAREEEAKQSERRIQELQEALGKFEGRMNELEQQAEDKSEALRKEIESSATALKAAAVREQELRGAQQQVRELTREVSTLKALVESKDRTMAAVKEETLKNAEMLMRAAETRRTLQQAESRLEHLTEQVRSLEMEVKSRDDLLEEIKEETYKSVEALKMAAVVNQHLNAAREREAELAATLEEREEVLQELRREMAENQRAVKAEQAVRSLETRLRELQEHNEALKMGVQRRDEAIATMRREVDKNVDILGQAAGAREELERIKARSGQLESRLQQRKGFLSAFDESSRLRQLADRGDLRKYEVEGRQPLMGHEGLEEEEDLMGNEDLMGHEDLVEHDGMGHEEVMGHGELMGHDDEAEGKSLRTEEEEEAPQQGMTTRGTT